MISDEVFLAFLASPLLASIVAYILGLAFIHFVKIRVQDPFKPIFALFSGMILFNVLFSLFVTKGLTIQVLFLPLLVYFLIRNRRVPEPPSPLKAELFLDGFKPIIGLCLFWSAFYFLCFYDFIFKEGDIPTLYTDIYYYVMVAENIWNSGYENTLLGINLSKDFSSGNSPYHYFELYQALIQGKVLGLSTLWSFIISVPIFFASSVSFFLVSLTKALLPKLHPGFIYLFGILLLFASGQNFLPFEYLEKGKYTLGLMNHVSPKYLLLYATFLLLMYLAYHRRYVMGVITLAVLPIFNFMMLPISLGVGLVGGTLLVSLKKIAFTTYAELMTVLFLVFLMISGFYAWMGITEDIQAPMIDYGQVFDSILMQFGTITKRIIGAHLYYTLDYLPYILMLLIAIVLLRKHLRSMGRNIQVGIVVLLLFEIGIVATWVLSDHHREAWQIQFFSLSLGSNALIAWFTITNQLKTLFQKIWAGLVIIFGLYGAHDTITDHYVFYEYRRRAVHVSQAFMTKCKELFPRHSKAQIAFIKEDPKFPVFRPLGNVLLNINPKINFECIDLSIISSENPNHKQCSFYQYVKNHDSIDLEQAQLDFMRDRGIRYYLSEQLSDQESLLQKNSTLVVKDPLTGLTLFEVHQAKF